MPAGPATRRLTRTTRRALAAAVLAAAALTLTPAAAPGYVYWTHTGFAPVGNVIGRASLAGGGVNASFITGLGGPTSVAVDGSHLYWANNLTDSIGRAKLDGSSPDPNFVTGASSPNGVAVDANHIYWSNSGTNSLGRASLDGVNKNQGFITGIYIPFEVAVDGSHVYWASYYGHSIGRADLDGGNADQQFITGANYPDGAVVDAGHVYWANVGSNTVGRASLDGTGVNQSFITGAYGPFGVAVDAGHIYWTNTDTNTIGRADLDGSGADQGFITTGIPYVRGLAVDGPAVSSSGAAFGSQTAGTRSAALPVLVTNTGTQPLQISAAAITGAASFAVTSDGCTGRTLAPGLACAVNVRFTPAATGDAAASLVLTDDASDSPQSLPLTGTGTPADAGPQGPAGLTGPLGPVGPAGPAGASGKLVLAAYQASVTSKRITVRYALTARAAVTLKVRTPKGSTVTAARATGRAGLNAISWNRRIKGRRAKPGTYRLTVTAASGGKTSSSTTTARLR